MISTLDPRYEIPSRKTLSSRVLPSLYTKLKEDRIMPALASANYYAMTTDCWTSRGGHSFIGLTAHFFDTGMGAIACSGRE